jgi:hypothetical protein
VDTSLVDAKSFRYGFDKGFNDMFKQRKAELIELSDIDPEKICLEDRPDILD